MLSPSSMPPPEVCERARRIRDARFDGLFFTAVRTTRIYCRSICPAPCAKSENVSFYPTAAAASAAGYRPCLRCRPESAPLGRADDSPALRLALRRIVDGWLQDRSVAALAAEVQVSERQLRRLFVEGLGATPLQIHSTRRLLLARQLLAETSLPMADVALAAGFNSVRRFNAAFREQCGSAPSSMRRRTAQLGDRGLTLRLAYRPPFDFDRTLAALRRSAVPSIEQVDATSYRRAIGSAARPGWIRVAATAGPRPELSLEAVGVPAEQIHSLVIRVRRMFDLDADLMPANRLLARDPLLAASVAGDPGVRIPGAWDGFECAALLLLQRCAGEAWRDLASAFVERYGMRTGSGDGERGMLFPSPSVVAVARLDDDIGVRSDVASTIRRLAVAVRDGAIDFGSGQRLEPFIAGLVANAGLDAGTAQLVALRALSEPDALPCDGDQLHPWFGVARELRIAGLASRADAWRPWRAYASLRLGLHGAARDRELHPPVSGRHPVTTH